MTDTDEAVDRLRRELHNSSGMAFVRRMRIRSSCLRMFTLNAYRLEDAFQTIDAKRLQLLHDDSGDISRQCNLVITYLLHNFVASAKTIVDHTRIFIASFYSGTSVESSYKEKIAEDVAPDKVCRFVHDLRNYMLHCGMPHMSVWSSLDMHSEARSGVYLYLRNLREWNGWTSRSKEFLSEHPEDTVDPDDIARSYCRKIIGFHVWLDQCLTQHHKDDLTRLDNLRGRLKALSDHPHDADQRTWDDWRASIHFDCLPWKPSF
jgi:hypothetical protein